MRYAKPYKISPNSHLSPSGFNMPGRLTSRMGALIFLLNRHKNFLTLCVLAKARITILKCFKTVIRLNNNSD